MTLDISRIHALCFDVDGTLCDTDDQFVVRLSRWFYPLRLLFPGQDPLPFSRRVVMATETPANLLFGLPDRLGIDDEIAIVGDWLYRKGLGRNPHPFILIAGIPKMLEYLYQRYPMSIVTSRGKRTTQIFLDQFNLEKYFRVVVTAQTCQHTKPYPDPILWAANKMNCDPQACVMIGDTIPDILAGKAAGAQTIGVLCGFGMEQELQQANPDLILEATGKLEEVL